MMSNIILRSTAAFGGAPFRLKKCTALGSAGAGAGAGASVGGVPGALVGGALGLAGSLLGGLFGKHNTDKTNKMNYQIMLEQNRFNAEEAKKNRDWQELMYRMFGTSSAKATDMRAAGLNALLGDVSASGNVGSGAAATAAESAQMLPTDYSFIGDAANHGLAAYNTTRSVDASVSLQKSQENVNKSIEGVNKAQEGLLESQNDMQKMTYKFAMDTYQNRLLQEQFKAELENWRGFDVMYDARLKAFSLYNVMPQEVEKNVAQTMSFYASAFRDVADGGQPDIKAIGVGDLSAGCKFTASTYGMIIGIYRAVPQLDYSRVGIDRNLFKSDATDFPIPELDSIGMQTQYRCELSAPLIGLCSKLLPYEFSRNALDMSVTYGYAPRYAELKSACDYFEGGFCGTYKSWVTGYDQSFLSLWRRNLGSQSLANYGSIDDLFKCRPSLLYPIFVNQWSGTVNDDKLLIGSVNTCVAVRPFSMYGLPYSK
jgi:hypothetical protein